MHPPRRPLLFAVSLVLAGCANPRVQANMAEAINEMGTEMSGIKQDFAVLQFQVDSLKQVAARQDTLIVRLANLAGVPIPK